jgi:hypothetical protein
MSTFVQDYIDGNAELKDVDDYVDNWHDDADEERTLQEFLGFTEEEYNLFIQPDRTSYQDMMRRKRLKGVN